METNNRQPDANGTHAHVNEGIQHLAKGQPYPAEQAFLRALEIDPQLALALHNMAFIRFRGGQTAEALEFAQRAVQSIPAAESYALLGECHEQLGQMEQAIACYQTALRSLPAHANLWVKTAELLSKAGRSSEAEDSYRQALSIDPAQIKAALDLAWILWRRNPEDAIHLLETTYSQVRGDIAKSVRVLSVLTLFHEWHARMKAGKAPYHADRIEDLFFHFASDDLENLHSLITQYRSFKPSDPWGAMTEATVLFARQNYEKAQARYEEIAKIAPASMAAAVKFDPGFFNGLSKLTDTNLLDGLPPVITIKQDKFERPNVLYMSCNSTYFDSFAKPLLRSLEENGPGTQVHIHLMDSSESHTADAVAFCMEQGSLSTSISLEASNVDPNNTIAARSYYHAIRFIRFYHHLLIYNRSLWLMDVDGLFNRSPSGLFDLLHDKDVCMRVRPGRLEPWNQFNACLFGVRPTDKGKAYLHRIAAYIAEFARRGILPWGIDQLAMYASYLDLERHGNQPQIGFLNSSVLDYDHTEGGILWCSSGVTKFSVLNRMAGKSSQDATAYDKAFMRYAKPIG